MAEIDEIRAFLKEEGYELKEGHLMGKSSGGPVLAEHFKNAMGSYAMWHVVAQKIGNPKACFVMRMVERPLRTGRRLQWADDPF